MIDSEALRESEQANHSDEEFMWRVISYGLAGWALLYVGAYHIILRHFILGGV